VFWKNELVTSDCRKVIHIQILLRGDLLRDMQAREPDRHRVRAGTGSAGRIVINDRLLGIEMGGVILGLAVGAVHRTFHCSLHFNRARLCERTGLIGEG